MSACTKNKTGEHILGALIKGKDIRPCILCGKKEKAKGTFKVQKDLGRMDIFPGVVFQRWTRDAIRDLLKLGKQDLILHNWDSDCVYVFRAGKEKEDCFIDGDGI